MSGEVSLYQWKVSLSCRLNPNIQIKVKTFSSRRKIVLEETILWSKEDMLLYWIQLQNETHMIVFDGICCNHCLQWCIPAHFVQLSSPFKLSSYHLLSLKLIWQKTTKGHKDYTVLFPQKNKLSLIEETSIHLVNVSGLNRFFEVVIQKALNSGQNKIVG